MAKEIIWSLICNENYKDIIEFLLEKCPFEITLGFTEKIEDWLDILSKNP